MHDWSRVGAGLYHHLHQMWITALGAALNRGILPEGYFALAQPIAEVPIPDVLALQELPHPAPGGGLAVADAPPKARHIVRTELDAYAAKADRLTIHHELGQVVAVLEIVSPGNKGSRGALRQFVEKATGLIHRGIHLLVIDPFRPGPRDPRGIHPAIWEGFQDEPFAPPPGQPLTLASYAAGAVPTAYVETLGVGDTLLEMPLFLTPESYVLGPLEATHLDGWALCPAPLRRKLEDGAGQPQAP
jgi:hypothetical protein